MQCNPLTYHTSWRSSLLSALASTQSAFTPLSPRLNPPHIAHPLLKSISTPSCELVLGQPYSVCLKSLFAHSVFGIPPFGIHTACPRHFNLWNYSISETQNVFPVHQSMKLIICTRIVHSQSSWTVQISYEEYVSQFPLVCDCHISVLHFFLFFPKIHIGHHWPEVSVLPLALLILCIY